VLLELGADASIKDAMQRTSLHWAVGAPDGAASTQCVELLFDRCSAAAEEMINCQSNSGTTPLHAVVSAGRADLARFLCERGADPTLTDEDGKTAAVLAKEGGLPKDIQNLLKGKGGAAKGGGGSSGLFSSKKRRGTKKGPDEVTL